MHNTFFQDNDFYNGITYSNHYDFNCSLINSNNISPLIKSI